MKRVAMMGFIELHLPDDSSLAIRHEQISYFYTVSQPDGTNLTSIQTDTWEHSWCVKESYEDVRQAIKKAQIMAAFDSAK